MRTHGMKTTLGNRLKQTGVLIVLMVVSNNLTLEAQTIHQWQMVIPDNSFITSVETTKAGDVNIITNDASVNLVLRRGLVKEFRKAFPGSPDAYLASIYLLSARDSMIAYNLKKANPRLFPYYNYQSKPQSLSIPDDYSTTGNTYEYLDYIGAPCAWGFTHGDPNVYIGISDRYLNTTHEDLTYKLGSVLSNPPCTGCSIGTAEHGTMVSGMAAAHTNNAKGIPSIGFNCSINFHGDFSGMWALSRHGSKIVNASWLNASQSESAFNLRDFFLAQDEYNMIYENGTSSVAAAGNGPKHSVGTFGYIFPASLDNVISVSNVGYKYAHGTPGVVENIADVAMRDITDPSRSYQMNSQVDILAPALAVTGLGYDPADPSRKYVTHWGTSAASPVVAGTIGLMLSAKPDLSPYQREWILKKTARKIDGVSENVPYAGKIGSGALHACDAVYMANNFNLNDPATQTMYIKGFEINTICAPGNATNGVVPKIKPIIINGVAPFKYVWEAVPGGDNTTTLDADDIETPSIVSSVPNASGEHWAYYRLTVYDNSPIAKKVAMKKIRFKLKTNGYDLVLRDSYMDMMNEANDQMILDKREDNPYKSPDIWNRRNPDGITTHENPRYSLSANHAYTRVRNVGCEVSPSTAKLRVYWTKASTGEDWDVDWTSIKACREGGGVMSAGGELGSGISLPPIEAGDLVINNVAWFPPKPTDYCGAPKEFDVCLLGRIEESNSFPYGMNIPEMYDVSVVKNVWNNNNIATRNMWLTSISPDYPTIKRTLIVANADATDQVFNLEFSAERSVFRHFSGDFSSLGFITLHLDELYDIWIAAGAQGNVVSHNPQLKTVTFDGKNTLKLDNIPLIAKAKHTVEVEFGLSGSAVITNPSSHTFFIRQYNITEPDVVYGGGDYEVTITPAASSNNSFISAKNQITQEGIFQLSPNPTEDIVKLSYNGLENKDGILTVVDFNGRVLLTENISLVPGLVKEINLAHYNSGVYAINFIDKKGKIETYKVIKKDN